jgi:flavodoxin
MKTLVIYYSFTQNNELLARELQRRLECNILKIETLKQRSGLAIFWDILFNRKPAIAFPPTDMAQYDQFIFVSPIWAARIASPLKTFLTKERGTIKHYSFITLCGGGNSKQHDKIVGELVTMLDVAPDAVAELWLSDLKRKGHPTGKPGTGQKIIAEDLLEYQDKIDGFLKSSKIIAAMA